MYMWEEGGTLSGQVRKKGCGSFNVVALLQTEVGRQREALLKQGLARGAQVSHWSLVEQGEGIYALSCQTEPSLMDQRLLPIGQV